MKSRRVREKSATGRKIFQVFHDFIHGTFRLLGLANDLILRTAGNLSSGLLNLAYEILGVGLCLTFEGGKDDLWLKKRGNLMTAQKCGPSRKRSGKKHQSEEAGRDDVRTVHFKTLENMHDDFEC